MRVFLSVYNPKLSLIIRQMLDDSIDVVLIDKNTHLFSPGEQKDDVILIEVENEDIHMAETVQTVLNGCRCIWLSRTLPLSHPMANNCTLLRIPFTRTQLCKKIEWIQ